VPDANGSTESVGDLLNMGSVPDDQNDGQRYCAKYDNGDGGEGRHK
jgi:hypothetical protein